jgi:hypothetical protein
VGARKVVEGIYLLGMIRVEGINVGASFVPEGYRHGDDFSQDSELLKICEKYFPSMAGHMWVGGTSLVYPGY